MKPSRERPGYYIYGSSFPFPPRLTTRYSHNMMLCRQHHSLLCLIVYVGLRALPNPVTYTTPPPHHHGVAQRCGPAPRSAAQQRIFHFIPSAWRTNVDVTDPLPWSDVANADDKFVWPLQLLVVTLLLLLLLLLLFSPEIPAVLFDQLAVFCLSLSS